MLADTKMRSTLLQKQPKKNTKEDKIPLVLSFSKALPDVHKIIKQNNILLKSVPEISE